MCTVTASYIIGVIFVWDPTFTQVFNTYFDPVFFNTFPMTIESMHVFTKTVHQPTPQIIIIWILYAFIIYRALNVLFHYIFIFISRQSFQAFYFRSFLSSRVINIYFVLNMPRKWKPHWDYGANFFPLNRAFALICYTHSGTICAVIVWFVIKLCASCTECFGDIIRMRWLWHPRLPHLNPCNRSTRWSRLKINCIVILLALKTIWKKASHYSVFFFNQSNVDI